ncbi:MAG: cytidylate kinase-like family protein [Ruminococcaceae bacterium]|nr:cytidylate kinase-like family protein [Oscillospiraceae bacterium]
MENYVITIGRQHGCGGRIIGRELAFRLGIAYYDKEIIHGLIAEETGIDKNLVCELMDKRTSSLLYELASFGRITPLEEQVFLAKTKVIRELATKSSCVFVGKCADYILREYKNKITIFLYGEATDRINRIVNEYGDRKSLTEHELKTLDRKRANYYHFFTTHKWGDRKNYDMMINTGIGLEGVTDMLEIIARKRFGG